MKRVTDTAMASAYVAHLVGRDLPSAGSNLFVRDYRCNRGQMCGVIVRGLEPFCVF